MSLFLLAAVCLAVNAMGSWVDKRHSSLITQRSASPLVSNTLCAAGEHIIFSCTVKRSAKIVSLCSSQDLTKDHGYLQYRFGLPGKIELEFPKDRTHTQEQFRYSHYFRYQVDETEITFKNDDYEYEIFDTYNGEEKPPVTSQGVTATPLPPARPTDVTLTCAAKAKADYSKLPDALTNEQQ